MAFVKLDCNIVDSTLWFERNGREVFITALLMAVPREFTEPVPQIDVDRIEYTGFVAPAGWYGFVPASGPGIIHRALVGDTEGREALRMLGSPDPGSRSNEWEGRRMIRVDGGYLILNYVKYREKDHTAAERMRRYREAKKLRVTSSSDAVTMRNVTQAYAEAEVIPKAEKKKKHSTAKRGARIPDNFQPSAESLLWINRKRPDLDPAELTEAFRDYWQSEGGAKACKLDWDKTWRNWARRQSSGVRNGKSTSKTMQGIQTLQAMKHGKQPEGGAVVPQLDFGRSSKASLPES